MKRLIVIMCLSVFLSVSCISETDVIEGISDINTNQNSTSQTQNLPTPKSNKQDINQKIGIVDGSKDDICLRTKNGDLSKDTGVSIVTNLDKLPQQLLNAVVKEKLESSCSRRASESTDNNPGENYYYSLALKDKKTDEFQEVFGFGVIEPKTAFRFQNDLASIDLNDDGKVEFFRTCQGFEGVLFAIWKGKPLKGKQIWHSFYYVDYATEPSCKKKDGADTDY